MNTHTEKFLQVAAVLVLFCLYVCASFFCLLVPIESVFVVFLCILCELCIFSYSEFVLMGIVWLRGLGG